MGYAPPVSGTLSITWPNIESMLGSMVDVGLQANDLDDYFQEHVITSQGLDYPTCALKPIGDQLPKLGTAFAGTRRYYQKRWVEVIEAIAASAADLDRADNGVDIAFGRYAGDLDSMPDASISVRAFEPTDLAGLDDPDEGEKQLKHNSAWEKTSSGYDSTRDGINEAIDFLNGLGIPGVSLPTLPAKSLEDYIVYPLAGNYRLLGANANACDSLDEAFTSWATNFTRLSGQVPLVMEGKTSLKLVAHLNLYALVMKSVGEGIGQGRSIFDAIAKMSEKIAVAVENAMVKMATKLTKLLTKLSSKLSPMGWVWFFAELVEKGFDAVKDIYDDIMECKGIITACFGLVDSITEWAQVMSDSLETMRKIRDIVDELPRIDSGGGVNDLPPVDLPTVSKNLGEISVEVKVGSDEEESLDDRLGELEGQTEEEEAEADDDDGDVIMAPGPIGEPGYLTGDAALPMA